MKVIVGGIIIKDNKVLMVQEKQERCYGKWNLPAGHLDPHESIIDGAIREIKEETGCDVKITGIATLSNNVNEDDVFIEIIFKAEFVKETIKIDPNEILDVKWFDVNDVLNNMDEVLRHLTFIKVPLQNVLDNKVGSLDIVNLI